MKKVFIFSLILISNLLNMSDVGAFDVSISGDRLTIHAEKIPLQDILKRMVKQGVLVRIDPTLNLLISASFENRDIQEALSSILKPVAYVLTWEADVGIPGTDSRLIEIQIFNPGNKDLMRSLDGGSGFVVVRNPLDGSLYIKDEILLMLKPGLSRSELIKLLKKIRGTLVATDTVLGIYRIRLPENSDISSVVNNISNYPGVTGAEPNYAYPIALPYKGENAIEIGPGLPIPQVLEGSAPIAILDSGLRMDSGLKDIVLASLDTLNPDNPISDSLGHGTQMALIAAGVVDPYGVKDDCERANSIIAIRAFDDNGFTSSFNIMNSVDFALKNGARVMSLSWGAETNSKFLSSAFEYAESKGLFIVASAGNEPTGKPIYPAAYSSVIGIGALRPDGKKWGKSNYGDFVEFEAPGFAKLPVGYKGEPGIYAGTSISAAFVARFISNYLSKNPEANAQDVSSALKSRF